MKTLYGILFFLTVSVLSFHCQKEIRYGGLDNMGENGSEQPITATLQGNITDETGQPAIGVLIKVGNQSALTDEHGYFRMREASLDKNAALVTAEKAGYFKAYRSFKATDAVNQVAIQLIKKELTGSVSSVTGGAVTLSNGASVTLPANGLVKALGGGAYSGTINVYASYIDPTGANIAATVPGSFMGNDKQDKRVTLASYGMMAVELESTSGEKLQIGNGNSAKLVMPIPNSIQSSAPATISLWYIDEKSGIWKEQGQAGKAGNEYIGEVTHFSFWNCDIGSDAIDISLTLKASTGEPLTYEQVRIRAATGYSGYTYGYTDSLGQVSGLVPYNTALVLEIVNTCNEVIVSQNIGPFTSSPVNLGTYTIPPTTQWVVNFSGKLLNCSNQAVTNGFVIVYYDNITRYVRVNNLGEFYTSFTTCSAAPATCEILGVDELTEQQGTRTLITVSTPQTETGNIFACGVSTREYVNYTLDGIDYSISNTVNDSLALYAYSSQVVVAPASFYNVAGGNAPLQNNRIEWMFYSDAESANTYPLGYIDVNGYNRAELQTPFNIVMSQFPQVPGEFYEGSFSGQFRDSTNMIPLHTISCSFRIKKW